MFNKIKSALGRNIKKESGFTLVELLIVIGILALLASVVIVAINPIQNLAKTRDAGRLDTVAQLGHALESYGTSNNSTYVPEAGCQIGGAGASDWLNCLINSGELNTAPALVTASIANPPGGAYLACGDAVSGTGMSIRNGWCYDATTASGGVPAVVYTRLESNSSQAKCLVTNPVSAAWAVYSTADGKSGIVCTANGTTEPTPGNQTFQ